MKKFKLFKMLAVLIVLITSINSAWASEWDDPMWQVYGWNGSSNGWLYTGIGKNNDYVLGVVTPTSPAASYAIKGVGVKTKGGGVKWVGAHIWYPDGSDNWKDIGKYNDGTPGDYYWENTAMWDHTIDTGADPGDYCFSIHFWMNNGGSNYNENERKITWTIPGFKTDNPTSFDFGANNPINRDNVAKIDLVHYGDWPTLGDCVLSGANPGDFEVIGIDYSSVTVVFKPTSVGAKSATLTITDTYDKTWTISLSGTGAANTATTRVYFNDYTNHSDWANDGALYRFTLEYTSGVYTRYNMTQVGTYNYYADVELKSTTPTIDRYNPSAPYAAWNWPTAPVTASNPYAISNSAYGVYVTNHPFNDVTGGMVYYDNSKSEFENTLYLAIGRDNRISDDAVNEYSKAYSLTGIEDTQLSYISISDEWHDATYYAVFGASSAPSGYGWGSNDLSGNADGSGYTAAYEEPYGLFSGSTYLFLADSKEGGALNISSSPTLNTTQTFNYALSIDNGSTFSDLTSGVNTPGQLSMASYQFTDGTYTAVEAKSAQTLSANETTYEKEVSNVAYTGTTTLTASSPRSGYTFVGWYNGSTERTSSTSFTYYPQGDSTFTARYKANQYAVSFDKESGTGGDNSVTATYEVAMPTVASLPTRAGYTFDGYWDGDDGTGTKYINANGTSAKAWDKTSATTLHAKWDPKELTFSATFGNDWSTAANWTESCVPTSKHDVTISAIANVSGSAVAKSVTIAEGGKLTIAATGVLEVQGTVSNSYSDRLIINTTSSSQGALICNLSSAPSATVNMTLPSSGFHLIASPTGGARVSSTFAGKGIYTYAWKEGKGWDHRGYYEDFTGGEAILIYGTTSCGFSGYLANFCGGSLTYSDPADDDDAQGVNMLSNTLTAPILISAMTLTNSYDGNIYLLESGVWQSYSTASGTNVIPALNGYAVISKSGGGSVSFDYTTAVRGASSKNAGLKAPQRTTEDEQDYMDISVTTNERKIDLRLYEDATKFTDTVDIGYEACYIEGDGRFGQLYAHAERKMTKLAKANLEGTVVGFAPGEAESFTISFEGDGKGYYLNDVKMEESTLIEEGNTYEFTSDEATNSTRFVISKTPIAKTPTSVDNVNDVVNARKQMINGTLYIVRDGIIYNAMGNVVK